MVVQARIAAGRGAIVRHAQLVMPKRRIEPTSQFDEREAKTKPPTAFVVSAAMAGLLLLSVGAVLIAAAIGQSFKGYIPGVVLYLAWLDYIRRPKSVAQLRWNWLHLLLLTIGAIGAAVVTNPNQVTVILMYWLMAIMMTIGAPAIGALMVVAVHQWVCARAAGSVVEARDGR